MAKIAIIIGSTRPNRFGPKVVSWLQDLAAQQSAAEFSVIDLAEVNLPFLDEPKPPMAGDYQNEHTKAWAKTIAAYDGYVIVTPEYNFGYPAALKNALDYLYAEWNNKPVAFVSYGASAGGARAVAQLRGVVANLKMLDLSDTVAIVNYWSQLAEDGSFNPRDTQTETAKKLLADIAVWAEKLQKVRAELAQ